MEQAIYQLHQAYQPNFRTANPEPRYLSIIERICDMQWSVLTGQEVLRVARAYHYFSIQFRENLAIACRLHPSDANLQVLHSEECDTANLSPWPGVAELDESLDHDVFIERLLRLQPTGGHDDLRSAGESYLATIRAVDDSARAKIIASYEDGGLSSVFAAILTAPNWEGPALGAFRHFLLKHIEFDSDSDAGHGLLARTLVPDDAITPLWAAFEDILLCAVPRFAAVGLRAA